jgi:hypothetical protein
MKKNIAFTVAVLKQNECLSVQLPFELPVQLLLELEANLLDQNAKELEFKLPYARHYKPRFVYFLPTF